ncbi:hypothetical protein NECAME_07466, partial [Necator americanus]
KIIRLDPFPRKIVNLGLFPGIRDLQVYLDSCSEDVRSLFERECSIMLECRTCKSIFRSFINFFSHKRGFCRSETCENKNGHFPPSSPKRIVGLRRTNLSKHVFKKLGVAEISGINEVSFLFPSHTF